MNRFTLSLFALAVGGVLSAHADDVTSTYITNADFEGGYSTYLTQGSPQRGIYQPNGWSLSYSSGNENDMSALNSDCLQYGDNFAKLKQLTGGGNNTYWTRLRWGKGQSLSLSQTLSSLPAGTYTLSADVFLTTDGGTAVLKAGDESASITASSTDKASGTWGKASVSFTISATQNVEISYTVTEATQDKETVAGIDNVTLITGYPDNTDITSKITNPSFESDIATGWTQNGTIRFVRQGNTSFGKTGSQYAEFWQPNGSLDINQTLSDLPAGYYKLTVRAKARGVTSAALYAGDLKQAVTIADLENEYSVNFLTDETTSSMKIGFQAVGTGAGSSWVAIDNFTLTYVSSTAPALTAATGKMNTAESEAQTTAINTYNSASTAANYNAALVAIATANTSIAAYANAATVLAKRKTQLDGLTTNFYTKDAYDTYYPIDAYNNGTLDDATAAALQSTSVTGWHAATQLNQFLGAAWGVTDYSGVPYVNTWSTEDNDNGFATPFYEYWVGSGTLGDRTLTGTISGLTANKAYDVTADVRVSTSSAPATGITMQVGNAAEVQITGTQIGSTTRYKDSYTATGVADADGNLTLKFNVASTNVSWLSFKNVKYVESTTADVDKLKAQEAVNDAIDAAEESNASLNDATLTAAIAAAQAVIDNSSSTTEELNSAATTLEAALSTAMTKDGADLTYKITNPSFEVNAANQSKDINGWTQSGTQKFELQDNKALNGLDGNYYAQRWHVNSDFDLNQTISLPAGYYHLTVRATAGAATSATLYAGSREKAIATDGTTADYAVSFQVTGANSDVKIGFKAVGTDNCWIAFDNFKLTAGVVAETGAMNATVKTTQDNAISAYQTTKSLDNYDAAVQAVLAAKVSEANYAAAKTLLETAASRDSSLDEAGQNAYTAGIAAVQKTYDDCTLVSLSQSDIDSIFVAAVKAQTTDGADMTLAIVNPTINGSDGWTDYRPNGGNGPLYKNSSFEYWAGNASGGKANGKFDYYQVITGLPIGQYTVSADMYNSLNGEDGATFSATSGLYAKTATAEDSVRVTEDGTTLTTYTTGKVTVTDGTLRIGVKNFDTMTARWFVADNFKLTYHKYEPTATVTAAKFATYVTETAVDFSGTTGFEAYKAKYDATAKTITLTRLEQVVPEGTAVVLHSDNAGTYTLTPAASTSATEVTDNDLKASDGTVTADGTQWALTAMGSSAGFAPVKNGAKIPSDKAYLEITGSTGAKFLPIGEGIATGISSVTGESSASDAPAYSLSGQRVGKSYKGVVIVNGKKVIRK